MIASPPSRTSNLRQRPLSTTKGAAGGTDKVYFDYGPLFRIDSLVAILMQFRTNKTEIRKDWFSGTRRTRDVMKILDRQDIISLTREVVVSVQASSQTEQAQVQAWPVPLLPLSWPRWPDRPDGWWGFITTTQVAVVSVRQAVQAMRMVVFSSSTEHTLLIGRPSLRMGEPA